MGFSQRFWRGLVFLLLIAALCGGMVLPMLVPAQAAPLMQATACAGTTITQWTFEGAPSPPTPPPPSTGSGTFSWGSGLTGQAYNAGSGGTGQAISFSGWTTSTSYESVDYVDFFVPTIGRNSIGISFDYRSSLTATTNGPTTLELHYSTDGTNYTLFSTPLSLVADAAFHPFSFDLSTITALDNNPNAAFRLYAYGAGGASGTLRFDNVTISGNCMALMDLTNTGVVNSTNTAVANMTGTAVANLTGTAVVNSTGTAASNQTGTAASNNQTGTAFSNQTGTAASNQTGTAAINQTGSAMPTATGIVISEFRAIGTTGATDEFIELYNPTAGIVAIGGWTISKSSGCGTSVSTVATIPTGTTLLPGQHYLIGGTTYSGTVAPDLPNQNLSIANDGGIALLNGTTIVDQVGLCSTTIYKEGTALAAIITGANRSYDRKANSAGVCIDTNNNAADFILRSPSDPQNRLSTLIRCGNPTPVPTNTPPRTATPRPSPTRTATFPPPPPLVAINEFVPRPGHDWNNDGVVNVQDEYVELINHGTIDVNLGGYTLDDEVNIGSSPYSLPAITISPGERIVFYGRETGLLLSDGGDGVRLLKPNGQLGDAYNYRLVRFPDQSFCRLPDNGGADDWNTNCFPTPGLQNALSGSSVSPPNIPDAESQCPIADTLPIDFILAECPPFGNNIWSSSYWDETGWYDEKYLPQSPGKWPVFAD